MRTEYILIAEDDEDDQFLLISAFRDLADGIELIFVENGIELVEHFRKYEKGQIDRLPSLLIVDLNMPKKNGREALKDLRELEYFNEFPTVIFSTTGNEIEIARCSELGINNFFVKPSNYKSLISLVSTFRQMASGIK